MTEPTTTLLTPTFVHVVDTSPTVVVSVLLGGAVLVILVATLVVVAPKGEYRIVTRGGTVRRVIESGAGWRLPGVDDVVPLPAAEHDHPLMVRATTLDGAEVVVLAEVVVRLQPPAAGHEYVDPWVEAETEAHACIRELVATLPVAEIGPALRAASRQLAESMRAQVRAHGVVLVHLDVVEVDLPLAGGPRDGS